VSRPDIDGLAHEAASETREVRRDFKQILLSGLALTVPFFITLLVLIWAFGWITSALGPLANLLNALGATQGLGELLTELTALGIVLGVIFTVGFAAQHGPNTNLTKRVDILMEDLPGIGSIYTSVEQMSDLIVAGDTESFREVKLVEFPREGSYALAFLTADTSPPLEAAADGEDLLTVFVPMAPNPVMGGHLLNLPRDRVHDVDLSVEEGMEAVVSMGMTIDRNNYDGKA